MGVLCNLYCVVVVVVVVVCVCMPACEEIIHTSRILVGPYLSAMFRCEY